MKGFRAPLPATDLVEAAESNAAKEPGPQRPPIPSKARSSLDQFEEGLLHRVLGGVGISQHGIRERVEAVGEKLIESMKRFGRESTHPVRECVQLRVIPITRDGSSWLSTLLGIGVDGSQMNVISYSVRETIDSVLEEPVICAGISRLVGGAFRGSIRQDNRTIRRTIGGDRNALDDCAILVGTWVGHANPVKDLITHRARDRDAPPVDHPIGHEAGKAQSVASGVEHLAGIGDAASVDNLVGSQTRSR